MRTLVGLALFLSALTPPAQNASAQLAEKKVLTSATAIIAQWTARSVPSCWPPLRC
jgi:hypothetical protein